jgi:hypothetical protein
LTAFAGEDPPAPKTESIGRQSKREVLGNGGKVTIVLDQNETMIETVSRDQ